MFSGCNSLIYANFTNFKTSNCNAMNWMFYGCSSLISLDLSSFNTESVRIIEKMFYKCNNLQYINMKNFQLSGDLNHAYIINLIIPD